MSDSLVTLKIDGVEVTVPKGTLLVDAAKQVGIEIPVFCYHPKLEPAGVCRMCLVEIGRPARDRSSGEFMRDENGDVLIQYGPKLETACTARVDDGWDVRVSSEKAVAGRNQIVEFLLTSHPLDCPICDKGGECPLQNLTMKHGPGKSRFLYENKMHLQKHVPLGDLIFLDRERCIQCSRCIRFQEEIAGDPVIEFSQRGRRLEIVTFSNPGFDSYFSGNTADICPVGALTTADFRFGARSWELNAAASLCTHCPVGCNLVLNTRREAKSGGAEVIKRVMPRQHEAVNEIWICDKGRFAHHFSFSPARITTPLVRQGDTLVEASWEQALQRAAEGLKQTDGALLGIAGGRASNEDLFNFKQMVEGVGGRALLWDAMAGGDLVQKVGVGTGTNLSNLGEGDAILVIASDLHEEAPIWWLRVKAAAERGAALVVANARGTRLDKYASEIIRYRYGQEVQTVLGLHYAVAPDHGLERYDDPGLRKAGAAIAEAENLVVFYGMEGMEYAGSEALALACGSLLSNSGHVGRANNGLIAVWPHNNTQGAWDVGLRPDPAGLRSALEKAGAVIVLAADPLGDQPALGALLGKGAFLVVQELFPTATTQRADVVFPACSFVERDGTFTSGERVVQRFLPAMGVQGDCLPDWQISARLGQMLDLDLEAHSPAAIMRKIAEQNPHYAGVDYRSLTAFDVQWPHVGDDDLYFGGTAFKNTQGLGIRIAPASERDELNLVQWIAPPQPLEGDGLRLVPIVRLYDQGTTVLPSEMLANRLASKALWVHPDDAEQLAVGQGDEVEVRWDEQNIRLQAELSDAVPQGAVLVPRSVGIPLQTPVMVSIKPTA